jgi:hypothetical protein
MISSLKLTVLPIGSSLETKTTIGIEVSPQKCPLNDSINRVQIILGALTINVFSPTGKPAP